MFKKEMSVSFHIGSKNNAIPNLKKLKTIFIHNLRKYEKSNNPDLDLNLSQYNIILQGTNNLVEDLKKLYKNEFDEAVYNYNQKQSREDRKIISYLNKIEEDKQKNIATEIIMQLGDKEDWQNIDLQDKKKMAEVFKNSLNVLENKGFKVANAVLHLDETSPHLHIIGVPIGTNFKKGMEKQVSSKSVFSVDKLDKLRDEIEKTLITDFNKTYNVNIEKKQEKALLQEHLSVKDYKELKPVIDKLIKVVDKNITLEEIKENLRDKEKEIKEVKEQDDFLLEYRIKIRNFNNDKEALEEKVKVAEKEKEEEEKKLDSKRKELAEIIANRKNIDFDLSEEKRKEEEKKKNNERINKLNAELEEQRERIKKLIEQEEAYNVNGFKITTPEKKFVEEAFEKGVEKVHINARPDEFYVIYYDKNDDEIKMNNEIFYNDADKYYNSVFDIAKHTRFSYNFKTGEILLETKSEDIQFKNSGIFNFIRTLNSDDIEKIMKHNYNIAKGIEDDEEEREIEKEYKETEKEVVKKKDEDEKDYYEY